MVKAAAHLAAGAIAAAFLLAGAGGAVAAADTPSESAGSENANSTASQTAVPPRPRAPLTTMRSPAAARMPGPPAMKPARRAKAKKPRRRTPLKSRPVTSRPESRSLSIPITAPAICPARASIGCRYVPKRHLPSTWSRCPKRRSRLPSKLRRPPTCPPSFPPRQPTPTRWTRLRAKQHTVQAGMNHRC